MTNLNISNEIKKDQQKLLLIDCISLPILASKILNDILKNILENESEIQPVDIITDKVQSITLGEFFNHLNTWYFYNDLSIVELQDWLITRTENPEWQINLAQLLIDLCKSAEVKNCFELEKYFIKKIYSILSI
jgi:hypothetical protein